MTLKNLFKFVSTCVLVSSILFVAILFAVSNLNSLKTEAALSFQRTVTVTSTSATSYTNYQVRVTLDTASLITAGKMRSDCGDIRTTDSTLVTTYNYFLEGPCNNPNTVLWVKIPSLPAGTTRTFVIQYGDPSLTSLSNGVNTLERYESGATSPTCTLLGIATWDSVNQWIRLTDTTGGSYGLCQWTYNPGAGFYIEYEMWAGGGNGADSIFNYAYARTAPVEEDLVDRGYSFTADEYQTRICFTKSTVSNGTGISCNTTIPTLDNSTWKTFEVKHSGRNAVISLNGTVYVSANDTVTINKTSSLFGIGSRTGGQVNEHRIRNVIVAKYDTGVTAVVGAESQSSSFLSFSIRNAADTANVNTCDMGTASTTAVSSCSYRLKVGTNAVNGFTISMKASGVLTNGSYTVNSAAAGAGGSGGTDISNSTAGTENYGVFITKGSVTGGTTALTSIFNAGATNEVKYDYTTVSSLLTASGANSPGATDTTNTSLVSHLFNISGSTPPGNYTQSITYTVAPSF
ncbi:MAG: DUF2341 domain-containing protein [bacterium]